MAFVLQAFHTIYRTRRDIFDILIQSKWTKTNLEALSYSINSRDFQTPEMKSSFPTPSIANIN